MAVLLLHSFKPWSPTTYKLVIQLFKQEDHDGPISLTWVLSSKGQQSYVPTCDPWGGASFDPRGIKWTNLVEVH